MAKKIRIYPESTNLSLEDGVKKYTAIFIEYEISEHLIMDAFYLPRRSIKALKKSFSKGRMIQDFTAYRELSANLFRDGLSKDIDYFVAEKVTHPQKLEQIARAFFAYQLTPRD